MFWKNRTKSPDPIAKEEPSPARTPLTKEEMEAKLKAFMDEARAKDEAAIEAAYANALAEYEDEQAKWNASEKTGFKRIGDFISLNGKAVNAGEILNWEIRDGCAPQSYGYPMGSFGQKIVCYDDGQISKRFYLDFRGKHAKGRACVAEYDYGPSYFWGYAHPATLIIRMSGINVSQTTSYQGASMTVNSHSYRRKPYDYRPSYYEKPAKVEVKNENSGANVVEFKFPHYTKDFMVESLLAALSAPVAISDTSVGK